MTTQTWFVDVDMKLQAPPSDALVEEIDEAIEPLHGAVAAGPGPTLGLSLAVDASDSWGAALAVRVFLEKELAQLVPEAAITSLRVLDEAKRKAENEAPRFPELVAVPDIADMLAVSRQQAHRLANREGFPSPVLTPRTGPLWTRAAVESWNERTERRKGRPPAMHYVGWANVDGQEYEIEYAEGEIGHNYRVYPYGAKTQIGPDIQGTQRVDKLNTSEAENMVRQALAP
jgi:predicted DNA-binding transcriptional regulator AlpA